MRTARRRGMPNGCARLGLNWQTETFAGASLARRLVGTGRAPKTLSLNEFLVYDWVSYPQQRTSPAANHWRMHHPPYGCPMVLTSRDLRLLCEKPTV